MIKKIGFIGLGHMGFPMALNLIKKGFDVYVCSSNAANQGKACSAGAKSISSFKEMASSCDAIVSIVPSDKEIMSLYMGEGAILSFAKDGLVVIDMTSAMGTTKRKIASYIKSKGWDVSFVDAPVSGGVKGAEAGTLTIMVGSDGESFEVAEPVLSAMGDKIFRTGLVGTGSDVKMINQMLNATNTAAAAEALCLSRKLGIEDKTLLEIVNNSSGSSFVFSRNVPKFMMTGDHTPGFMLDLMKKDVGLFVFSAREVGEFAPLSSFILNMYEAASNQGMGALSYTALHKWYEGQQPKES